LSGQIIDIEEKRDNVFIYVEGEKELLSIGWAFFEDWMCKSKSEAIYLMIKRLEELRDE